MAQIVIIGASGHASDILGLVEDIDESMGRESRTVGVLLDDQYRDDMKRFGDDRRVELLGPPESLAELDACFLIAVGYPAARWSLFQRIAHLTHTAVTLIHPSTTLGAEVTVGPGSAILAGVRISPLASIGSHSYLSHNSVIGHHTQVGDFVSVMPAAAVSGDVEIGDRALIGTHATILEKCVVGEGAIVGAGALVTKDVPPGVTVVGVPAKPL